MRMRNWFVMGISAAALTVGAYAYADQTTVRPRAETYRMMELFGDVVSIVEREYVVPVDQQKMIEAALNGMLTSLDPHSSYLSPSDFSDLRDRTRGQYSGIGTEISQENGVTKIITPMDDGPAYKAGVQAGDVITAVDGESVVGMPLPDVSNRLRGAVGTKVRVTLQRAGADQPIELTLTREVIAMKSVRARREGEFGVVRISYFNEHTGKETADAVRQLLKENPKLKGVVLDLRNNPGGILESSVETADVFLNAGEVVQQRGRDPRDVRRYNATAGDLTKGLPVVVLVNYGSASAAEIVAGALQDHRRATVLGLTSFGKGSVQTVRPLASGGALRLTTARYYTPAGRSIQKTGIEPDLEVARSLREAEIVSDANFRFSEAIYRNALDSAEKAERKAPHAPKEVPPEGWDEKEDFQLKRAFQLLEVGGDIRRLPAIPASVSVASAEKTDAPSPR